MGVTEGIPPDPPVGPTAVREDQRRGPTRMVVTVGTPPDPPVGPTATRQSV
jgi:hypothetical protein